jgi:hypothetical protein
MAEQPRITIAVIGVDIGKNSLHVVGLDRPGAIALRQMWIVCRDGTPTEPSARLANVTAISGTVTCRPGGNAYPVDHKSISRCAGPGLPTVRVRSTALSW